MKNKKEVKDQRITVRMTETEAKLLVALAKKMNCKTSYLARLGFSAVAQAAEEQLAIS